MSAACSKLRVGSQQRRDELAIHRFEGREGLAKGYDVFETLKQDLAKCDAANRSRSVRRRLIRRWKVYGKQAAEVVIEEGDACADPGRGGHVSREVRVWKARLQGTRAPSIDCYSIALYPIGQPAITLKDAHA